MQYILQKTITFYQIILSPLLPCACRFHPSCSEYSKEAIKAHGCCKGLLLTAYRLARCNPLFKSGLDPVPQKFSLGIFKSDSSCAGQSAARHTAKPRIRSLNR